MQIQDDMVSTDTNTIIFQTEKVIPNQKRAIFDLLGSIILSKNHGYIQMFYSEFSVVHQEKLDQSTNLTDILLKFVAMMHDFKQSIST